MAPSISKKRRIEDAMNGKTSQPKKKFKKQLEYHSSSSENEDDAPPAPFSGVTLQDSDSDNDGSVTGVQLPEDAVAASNAEENDASASDSENDSDSSDYSLATSDVGSIANRKQISKRNDPAAFSTSISKILGTKLSTSARADPVLSRSKSTAQTTADIANEKLEKRARAKIRAEKKEELERGRVKDVLGVERGEAGETAEQEKRLRKIAQRGVVKLFNAVRAAQVRGEEAAREERRKRATVGMDEREKKVTEVSKQGFLELINGKGKKVTIEEA
ncbi:hypothetical protein D8B26_006173 [Coccidioides posadasii str. Silveira]|uniref:Uncharacterized protein n=2 Tax=Coccidioides posadasii TaxID=199306 RepID=E9DBF2_COCPS|nr:rRNA processing protein RRP15 [Coccidioides posadasii C735 delta SOWgp]EER27724.1 hypothetical protein CPC735_030600 [Coccidioides posadasii C735 delta SOWgp]EFW16104.1 hypothetical protein CPSG_07154 [Coccidioides posadasii str. Silveira]QVM11526.1 hypothetical protein D8B26_006173 [Coccidioides posadasii str. Silveira]|eukprot:XP_003069869.1 rRNA processing protein RRP15 [Coccidioides posadasii C735 delta SOWgp]